VKRDRGRFEARIDPDIDPGAHDLDGDGQHDDQQQPEQLDQHDTTDHGDAYHVRPITLRNRLTGERQPVLSLDGLRDVAGDSSEAWIENPTPTSRIDLDWPALLKLAGFTEDESKLIITNRIQEVPRGKLAKTLGWKSRKVEAVRKRVARKLAARKRGKTRQADPLNLPVNVRSDPSRSAHQLRFPSGVTCWELDPSGTNKSVVPGDIGLGTK
jgi:hypothetical protein